MHNDATYEDILLTIAAECSLIKQPQFARAAFAQEALSWGHRPEPRGHSPHATTIARCHAVQLATIYK